MFLFQALAVRRGILTNQRPDRHDIGEVVSPGWGSFALNEHCSNTFMGSFDLLATQFNLRLRGVFLFLYLLQLLQNAVLVRFDNLLRTALAQRYERLSEGVGWHDPAAEGATVLRKPIIVVG